MKDDILRRIQAQAGQDLAQALAALAPRDLRSLLLHVLGERARAVQAHELLERYEELRATRPSYGDARAVARFEVHALAAAAAFDALELSPVVPLGAAHALGGTHPYNVLAGLRGLEVAGDPSTALALEAARRRRRERGGVVRACAVSRVMRLQPVPPPFLPHFKLFAMVSAGRREDVLPSLREHLAALLDLTARLRGDGFVIPGCVAEVSDPACVSALLERAGLSVEEVRRHVRAHQFTGSADFLRQRGIVLPRGPLAELDLGGLPPRLRDRLVRLHDEVLAPQTGAELVVDLSRLEGLGYYVGPTLRVLFTDAEGRSFPVGDGGVLDWSARILGDGGERLVTSGMGVDIVCSRFL